MPEKSPKDHTALIVGFGSIGRRHAVNLKDLDVNVFVVDPDPAARGTAAEYGFTVFESLETGLTVEPSVTLVCTPPDSHLAAADAALDAGSHVFVEKPLASRLDGTRQLVEKAKEANRVLSVGYNWRFHPGLELIKSWIDSGEIGAVIGYNGEFGQYLPDWRPGRDYRDTYTARRGRGGGIVLDASHEIDLALWLVGDVRTVSCVTGNISDLEMTAEDVAEITLEFQNGAMGHLHVDCVRRGYARSCRVLGTRGTVEWNVETGSRILRADQYVWQEEECHVDFGQMYVKEIQHFLDCVGGAAKPRSDAADARRVLEVARAALRSAKTRKEVLL